MATDISQKTNHSIELSEDFPTIDCQDEYEEIDDLSCNMKNKPKLPNKDEKLSHNVKNQESRSGDNRMEHGSDTTVKKDLNQSNGEDIIRQDNSINKRRIMHYTLGFIGLCTGSALLVALLWYTLHSGIDIPMATDLAQNITETNYARNIAVYSDLLEAKFYFKKKEAKMSCKIMLAVKDQIWCTGYRTLYIFSMDSMKWKKRAFPNITKKLDFEGMTYTHTGHIILAIKRHGLHQMLDSETYAGKIAKGSFGPLCSFNKKLYAVDEWDKRLVTIFQHNSISWIYFQEITMNVVIIQSLYANDNFLYLYDNIQAKTYVYDKKMAEIDFIPSFREFQNYKLFCGVDREGRLMHATTNPGVILIYGKEKWHQLNITLVEDEEVVNEFHNAVVDRYNGYLWLYAKGGVHTFDIIQNKIKGKFTINII